MEIKQYQAAIEAILFASGEPVELSRLAAAIELDEEATARLAVYDPLLVDAVPLTLEEIFIYELGGADYAVKDIVL